jgi:hypothetical protein
VATGALEGFGATWPSRPAVAGACLAAAVLLVAWRGNPPPSRGWAEVGPEALLFAIAAALAPSPWPWLLACLSLCAIARWERMPTFGAAAALARVLLAIRNVLLAHVLVSGTIEGLGILTPSFRPSFVAGVPLDATQGGVFFGISMWVAWLALALLAERKPTGREAGWVGAGLVVIAAIRFGAVAALAPALAREPHALEWTASPPLSMALFTLLWLPVTSRDFGPRPQEHPARWGWRFGAALALVIAVMRFLLFFEEPGVPGGRRMILDDGVTWAIAGFGPSPRPGAAPRATSRRDVASLDSASVLVVLRSARAYSAEERVAVERFVRAGGGLLLVAGPATVAGTHAAIDVLARHFGFEFADDRLQSPLDPGGQRYAAPGIARHPILEAARTYRFPPTCSIVPLAATVRTVVRTGGLSGMAASESGDFASGRAPLSASTGPHVQLVARHCGRGRIAGLATAQPWTLAQAGAPDPLAAGLMEWLARRNRLPDAYTFSRVVVIALLLFIPALLWLRPRRSGLILALAAAANLVGTRTADHMMRRAYSHGLAVRGIEAESPSGRRQDRIRYVDPGGRIAMAAAANDARTGGCVP